METKRKVGFFVFLILALNGAGCLSAGTLKSGFFQATTVAQEKLVFIIERKGELTNLQ